MTSTNSLNSNRFIPMLKNVFKRNIVMFLMLPVFSVLFSSVITQTVLDGYKELLQEAAEGYTRAVTQDIILTLGIFLYGAGTVCMFIFAATLFREIFSKRSSTFYFSMPVKRGVYFNTNMIFGIVSLLLSYIVLVCIPIAIIKGNAAYQAGIIIFEIPVFINHLTITALCVAVSYAVFLLCAVLSGRVWHYLVLCLIASQAGNVVSHFRNYMNTVWGFHIESSLSWLVSPSAIYSKIFGELITDPLKYIIVLIVQFAVVYAAGYIVFKNRKAEVAEVSLTGRIVPAVMITVSLLSVSFAFLSTEMIASGFVKLFIAIIAALLAAMLLTAIFYKKAFTKNTLKCFIATVIITAVSFAAVEFIQNISFKNYVPVADEVESVTLDENVDFGNEGSISTKLLSVLLGISDESLLYNHQNGEIYTFTSEEAKAKVEELHKIMIDENTIKNYGSEDFYYHGYYSVRLTYKLKNGKTVTRAYCVGTKDVYKEYAALMQSEEALWQTAPLNFSDEDIQFIGFVDYASDDKDTDDYEIYDIYYAGRYLSLDEYHPLFEQVVKDKQNESKETFLDLHTPSAFYLYDLQNYYRRDDFIGDDYDYGDIIITFFTYSEYATDEQKELLKEMLPLEKVVWEEEYLSSGNYGYIFDETNIYLKRAIDVNSVEYLKSIGLIEE